MAKITIKKGTTSHICHIFIQDASSVDGAGLTGLLHGGISGYWVRPGDATDTAISLVTISTLGTWVTGGFKQYDSTNMPGLYELHLPDAALASATGKDQVVVMLKGGTNMVPVLLEIQLTDFDLNDATPLVTVNDTVADAITAASLDSLALAAINAEVDTAIETYKLDHLIAVADGDDPVNGSIIADMVSATGDWSTFTAANESLEALRARGDSSWITSVATSTLTIAQVNTEVDTALADIHLDHLIAVAESGQVANDSIMAQLAASDTPATWASFNNVTDSLESIQDDKPNSASITALIDAQLVLNNLDHLFKVPILDSDVVDNSFAARITDSTSVTANYTNFDHTTDSLRAIRDNTAWNTATGFSTHSAADVWGVGTKELSALTSAQEQGIADEVLSRNVSNVQDTMPEHCLGTAVQASLEWDIVGGTTWNIRKIDGSTLLYAKTLTRTASLNPVTAVD